MVRGVLGLFEGERGQGETGVEIWEEERVESRGNTKNRREERDNAREKEGKTANQGKTRRGEGGELTSLYFSHT